MTGKEEQRARDLFYALWIPDLFMKRVEANEDWTLMCPHECPGLADVYGDEFVKLYEKWVTCIMLIHNTHAGSVLELRLRVVSPKVNWWCSGDQLEVNVLVSMHGMIT